MAFKIADTKGSSFFYPVKVPVVLDSGRKKTFTFDMKFKRMSKSAYFEALKSDDTAADDPVARDANLILDIAEDWRHVQDEQGADLPFSFENVYQMINDVPSAAVAIISTFNVAVLAGGQAEKN